LRPRVIENRLKGTSQLHSGKTVFIVNPSSGNGSTGREWPRIEAMARERLGEFETFMTTGPGDATLLTRRKLLDGCNRVVCVGGDGTLNEVVNGFMEESGPLRPEALLGFLPNGTGCDFCRTVCKKTSLENSIDMICAGHVRTIDLGRVKYQDHAGRPCIRYFHNITSFGLGGEVVDRVNHTSKACGPFLSFIWATLVGIFVYGKKHVRFHVDEGLPQDVTILNIAVANGQYHGGGMQVAPDARIDDGLFHITVIGNLSLPEIFWHLPKLYNGKIKQIKKVFTLTGRKIAAASEQKVLLDVDGEQPGRLPVTIEIVPAAIRMIMP
jgi:YegS/Rv2252/BmrU family lipid kinase